MTGNIETHEGDVTNYDSVRRCVAIARPEIVFHLAGDTTARRSGGSWDGINRSIAVNLIGTLNVVRAAAESEAAVKRIVRAGGLEEYGTAATPFVEEDREQPVSAYSASQVATTHFLEALQKQFDIELVTLRPALAYGPFQDTRFFIPHLIESCLSGENFEMTDGTQSRDLVHVEDVANGFLLAASAPELPGRVINLASGEEHSLNEVANLIVGLTAASIDIVRRARPTAMSDLQHLKGSTDLAARLLDWRAKISLTKGLERTIEWHRERRGAGSSRGSTGIHSGQASR